MSYEYMQGMGMGGAIGGRFCEEGEDCPTGQVRENIDISFVDKATRAASTARQKAMLDRGCTSLCTPRSEMTTGIRTKDYCCPPGTSTVDAQPSVASLFGSSLRNFEYIPYDAKNMDDRGPCLPPTGGFKTFHSRIDLGKHGCVPTGVKLIQHAGGNRQVGVRYSNYEEFCCPRSALQSVELEEKEFYERRKAEIQAQLAQRIEIAPGVYLDPFTSFTENVAAPPVVTNGNGNGNGVAEEEPKYFGFTAPQTNGVLAPDIHINGGGPVTPAPNGNGVVVQQEKKYFGFTAPQLLLVGAGGVVLYMLLKK